MKAKQTLQYQAITPDGIWWDVKLGHNVMIEGYRAPFVVTGWDQFGGLVYLGQNRIIITRHPEELDMRYIRKPTKRQPRKLQPA